jgi:hypothetical protein
MNPIFLAVLLSVFGTLSIGYLVWSIVGLREVLTKSKDLRKDVDYLNDSLGKAESQIQNDIRKFHEESIVYTDDLVKDIQSDIDRRFDKIYQKFYSDANEKVREE